MHIETPKNDINILKQIDEEIKKLFNKYEKQEKNWEIKNALKDEVLEYVLSYKENEKGVFNTTIFSDILWLSEKETYKKTKYELIKLIHKEFSQIQLYLEKIYNKLENINIKNLPEWEKLKIKIYKNWIKYYIKMLEIAYWWSFAEIEKLWFKQKNNPYKWPNIIKIKEFKISKNEIENIIRKIENELFPESKQEEEQLILLSIKYLNNFKTKNFKERAILQKAILELLKYFKWHNILEIDNKLKNINQEEKITIPEKYDIYKKYFKGKTNKEIENIIENKLNKILSPEQLKNLFEITFKIYGLEKKVIIDPTKSNILDAPEILYIPTKSKYSLKKAISLIAHEIETHYITKHNHEKILWETTPPESWYLQREESLAKIMENILDNKKPLLWKITPLYKILEYTNNIELKEKIKLTEIFIRNVFSKQSDPLLRFLRTKRFHFFDSNYTQKKDISYSKFIDIYNYLKHNEYEYLFSWKLNINTIKENKKILSKIFKNNEWILLPLFIAEYIKYLIITEKIYNLINNNELPDIIDFLKYIKYKYKQIGFDIKLHKIVQIYENFKLKNHLNKIIKDYRNQILAIIK